MRGNGVVGVGPVKTKKTTLPGLAPVAAPDLVRRNFTASRPDELWLADFTYIRDRTPFVGPLLMLVPRPRPA